MLTQLVATLALYAVTPLPPEVGAALHGVVPDPQPTSITRDTHYLSSNEWRLETFAPALHDVTGTLIGVGADQNYFFAGWSQTSLVVLMDFDQWVVDLHGLNAIAFATADTPDAFMDFWTRSSRAASEAKIRAHATSPRDAQRLVQLYRLCRTRIVVRLEKVRATMRERKVASFLTDQGQYDHVASLSRTGRIIALRGDLTKRGALQRLTAVLKRYELPVGALYLSNAEQYFGYSPSFRANIASVPASQDALLLRTRPTGPDYTYCVQELDAFHAQLQRKDVHSVRDLAPRRVLSYGQARYDVPLDPPMNRAPKRAPLRGATSSL